MRHLFSNAAARPTDAVDMRLGAPRACAAPGASSGTAGRRRASTHAEHAPSTPACSSTDPGRKTNRSPPAGSTTGNGNAEIPRPCSGRNPHWTSAPLPGETSLCGTKPQVEKAQGRPASLLTPGPSVYRAPLSYLLESQSRISGAGCLGNRVRLAGAFAPISRFADPPWSASGESGAGQI
jgi:hypothetical protein